MRSKCANLCTFFRTWDACFIHFVFSFLYVFFSFVGLWCFMHVDVEIVVFSNNHSVFQPYLVVFTILECHVVCGCVTKNHPRSFRRPCHTQSHIHRQSTLAHIHNTWTSVSCFKVSVCVCVRAFNSGIVVYDVWFSACVCTLLVSSFVNNILYCLFCLLLFAFCCSDARRRFCTLRLGGLWVTWFANCRNKIESRIVIAAAASSAYMHT